MLTQALLSDFHTGHYAPEDPGDKEHQPWQDGAQRLQALPGLSVCLCNGAERPRSWHGPEVGIR